MADGARVDDQVADTLRKLAVVFADFEQRLEATPLIRKLTRGRFELADYQLFLINLRQQVKDGALWMSRAASNVGESHLELRSTLMRHAVTEHRDFRLLEADFVCSGGEVEVIRSACWAPCSSSRGWARSRPRPGAGWSRSD